MCQLSLKIIIKKLRALTPLFRKWADICDSNQSSHAMQGWAIAAGSVVSKSPHSSISSKKKESFNIDLSGDICEEVQL